MRAGQLQIRVRRVGIHIAREHVRLRARRIEARADAHAVGAVVDGGELRDEAAGRQRVRLVVDHAVVALQEPPVRQPVADVEALRLVGPALVVRLPLLLPRLFLHGRGVQGQDAVNERGILRGIEALILVSCQPGRRDPAALRKIPRIAEQVELRRAEHHRQHQTAGRKPAPAAAEDKNGLLQEHFSGKIAHERANRQKQQHVPEIIRRVAREQLDQQHADDQRAADRKPIQRRRTQLAHGDHVAAALHLPVLQQQIRADGEDHAHARQNAEIPPAHQMRVRLIAHRARVDPFGRHAEAAAQQAEDRRSVGCGAFGRGRLARGHAVDKGLHQMLHDRLEHVGGKIQHPVDERRSRHLPDDHAHQRRKREKQQKTHRRRREHLHRGQKGRHAEACADRP